MSLFIKIISLYSPIHFLSILYPTSLANLLVEMGIRHSHQILFFVAIRRHVPPRVFLNIVSGRVAFSAPGHWYLDQLFEIVFEQWNCKRNPIILIWILHLKMSPVKCRPFSSGWNVLNLTTWPPLSFDFTWDTITWNLKLGHHLRWFNYHSMNKHTIN